MNRSYGDRLWGWVNSSLRVGLIRDLLVLILESAVSHNGHTQSNLICVSRSKIKLREALFYKRI